MDILNGINRIYAHKIVLACNMKTTSIQLVIFMTLNVNIVTVDVFNAKTISITARYVKVHKQRSQI